MSLEALALLNTVGQLALRAMEAHQRGMAVVMQAQAEGRAVTADEVRAAIKAADASDARIDALLGD